MKKPTYIDLFAGCGGLSLGLNQAGWQGLFAIEKSSEAFATLEHNLINNLEHFNWPDWLPKKNHDINDVLSEHQEELKKLSGKVDLIAGGPPCQGFSSAGRRVESDARNELIDSYLEFISIVNPKVVFFENVKGFTQKFKKNKTKGQAYADYVSSRFQDMGYNNFGQLIDFSEYGIPQKRTRYILVALRKDILKDQADIEKIFFKKLQGNAEKFLVSKNLTLQTNLEQAISDLLYQNGHTTNEERRGFKFGLYGKATSSYQVYMRNGVKTDSPNSHSFPNHKERTVERFRQILQVKNKNKNLSKSEREKLEINKHVTIPLDAKSPSPTLTTLPDDYIHYSEPRILTVREYARIQSFPDWFEFKKKYTTGGKNRTKEVPRYSQIGNAIPPLFGEQAGLILQTLTESYA
ncbi:DNA cytosine methyltransferase [Marinoscillum furvescens]|uniref:Cytosine-specific methyltransferase n=1 Tax=Marinoscillum furvescens DSM 4134 TaxID=1122208 RepID=A0A3D9KVP2_MARFU|nr:DNA cytosine methyltransferase [Marinoscillum furvescens]RED91644.1 DNA (cytosine-5)-methyltransferase 1 [Marinoscillum furvescens DSM 4134]